MIELHAYPHSANSRKIHWALEELGVPYQYVLVDLAKRAQKQPDFMALNPHGRVPVLVDGAFKLYESNAILIHLADRFREGELGGRDAQERALIHQWLFVQAFDLQPFMQEAWLSKYYAALGLPFDAERHARALAKLPPGLAVLEAHLAGKSHVVGNRLTIADIALAEPICQAELACCDLSAYPHILRWFEALSKRPAFERTRPTA